MSLASETSLSGVTRVGDTRGDNCGCHPSVFSRKTWRPFLVASSAVSPLISSSQKLTTLFAHRFIAFYCFHSGVTPSRVLPYTFFYLSDLVSPLFFVNLPTKFFSFGCHPSGGCHPGRSGPSLLPSDATASLTLKRRIVN